ncbi:MAG: MBL fold metallo-hydrolase [Eubacteriales bacterium]|jgi:metallo-beta-lactamase family protein|nr:MBL fold metallo-hydrolase [Eubacteriales bacterium]MDD4104466.1 MBL fold metallo-hydrolase [Eubacteriales bacterium]MDD4709828.1 MBL fold metallo-hydrolase [Eubacteriales bacterium]NLO15134.1 MBL fold metallo-hydrolase [Clostridiales bacterium]
MDLLFAGAAREVTGSRFLLRANGQSVLIDCGMEQGRDTYENQRLPISPSEVDTVVLTHAHIDHSGMLPALYKKGFRGTIWATPATIDLCDIMLRDSAYIQETEAEWRNRKAKRKGGELYEPLYTQQDAEGTVRLMQPASYVDFKQVLPGISLVMTDAGHLLGSASATLAVTENGVTRKVVFSGDIGNIDQPIINDPHYLKDADVVVMESTYGDRLHGEKPDYIADLTDALQTTFDRGGNVVIPSFAVGRSQELLYFLREIKQRHLVRGHDDFPVYMDSPLAIRATNIFGKTDGVFFDDEMNALLDKGINPISFDDLQLMVTADESKQINFEKRPCVIISASGMCEAGRIRHHLKHNLWRADSTILFVGYQSVGTLGRQLVDGAKEVRLFGEDILVNAQVRMMKAMSGHADRNGLKKWADAYDPRPEHFYIVHGEEGAAESFALLLTSEGFTAHVPYPSDVWDLVTGKVLEEGSRKTAVKSQRWDQKLDSAPGKAEAAQAVKPRAQNEADKTLYKALERLQKLVDKSVPWSNGIKRQIAEGINKLTDKWE